MLVRIPCLFVCATIVFFNYFLILVVKIKQKKKLPIRSSDKLGPIPRQVAPNQNQGFVIPNKDFEF